LARVRGFTETQVILREALRNAALPTLTLIGVQFTFLIGGTVIVERLFAYEGLGNMAIDAVINRDLPLIQGIVLTFAGLFILINLAVDLAYTFLNPRLRHGGSNPVRLTLPAALPRPAAQSTLVAVGRMAAARGAGRHPGPLDLPSRSADTRPDARAPAAHGAVRRRTRLLPGHGQPGARRAVAV